MQQIALKAAGGAVSPMPRTSRLLASAVDHARRGSNQPPLFVPMAHRGRLVAEAAAVAEVLRPHLAPAGDDHWAVFLTPLVAAVRNPPSPQDFEAFVAACAGALTTIPGHLMTPARQAEALRRFTFWPAVADLAAWLEPGALEVRSTLRALERIASTVAEEPA